MQDRQYNLDERDDVTPLLEVESDDDRANDEDTKLTEVVVARAKDDALTVSKPRKLTYIPDKRTVYNNIQLAIPLLLDRTNEKSFQIMQEAKKKYTRAWKIAAIVLCPTAPMPWMFIWHSNLLGKLTDKIHEIMKNYTVTEQKIKHYNERLHHLEKEIKYSFDPMVHNTAEGRVFEPENMGQHPCFSQVANNHSRVNSDDFFFI